MAQIMKISVVNLAGESTIIPLISTESLEEFRTRVLKDYDIKFSNENLSNVFLGLALEDNLFNFLNSQSNLITENYKNEDEMDYIYEIHLNDTVQNDSITYDIDKTEENLETYESLPLMDLNGAEPVSELASVLNENIFHLQSNTGELQILQAEVDTNVESDVKDINDANENYNYTDIESKLREIHENEPLTNFCRLCSKSVSDGSSTPLHKDQLSAMVNAALPINVKMNDGLPQQLCEQCVEGISQHFAFVQTVIEADKLLRAKFNIIDNIKAEPEMPTEFLSDIEESFSESDIKCRLCNLILDNAYALLRHCKETHFVDNLTLCGLCNLGFESTEHFTEHIEEHQKQFKGKRVRKYQCMICSQRYLSLMQLQKHTCAKITNKSLHCEVCNQAFPTKVRLNFHRQFHLKNARPLVCAICNITFEDENEYFDHVNFLHDTKQVYSCDMCDKTFSMRTTLNNHKKMHFGIRNFKCKVCNKQFVDRQTLKDHEISHMDTKPYQCHVCGKNLNRLSRLKQHLLTHDSNPVVNDINVCSICKETFANEALALEHQTNEHEGQECIEILSTDRVFRCEFCERCFSIPDVLNTHRSSHIGPIPYTCHICKAQFSTFSRCTTHKSTHGLFKDGAEKQSYPVVKHFLCEHCGKSYLHWSYLGLHRRLKHSDNVHMYKCSECSMEFPTSWAIAYHRKTKHQEKVKCNDCGKYLTNMQVLKTHQLNFHSEKNKDVQCDKCGKIFMHQATLDAHMKTHAGVREYKCTHCPKTFVHQSGLMNHVKIHKERQYSCAHCDKKFTQQSDCVEHEALHIGKHKFGCESCGKMFDTKANLHVHNKLHTERPFTCDECGMSFRRLFTLRSHKNKHNKQSGSFVLMVDMKEDNFDETEDMKETNPNEMVQTVMDESQGQDTLILNSGITGNYIDLGNGNYLPIQGNTITIGDKQFFLLNDHMKTADQTQTIQMIVDDTDSTQQISEIQDEQFNGTVMLVDNSSIILDQNQVQSEYVFSADSNLKPNTTFIVENQLMLDADDQTF